MPSIEFENLGYWPQKEDGNECLTLISQRVLVFFCMRLIKRFWFPIAGCLEFSNKLFFFVFFVQIENKVWRKRWDLRWCKYWTFVIIFICLIALAELWACMIFVIPSKYVNIIFFTSQSWQSFIKCLFFPLLTWNYYFVWCLRKFRLKVILTCNVTSVEY